jgi:hypothetical protein
MYGVVYFQTRMPWAEFWLQVHLYSTLLCLLPYLPIINKNEFVSSKYSRDLQRFFHYATYELVHFFCAILRNRVNGGRVAFAFLCMRERPASIFTGPRTYIKNSLMVFSLLLWRNCCPRALSVLATWLWPASRPGYWSLASQIKRHAVRRLTTPLLPPDRIKPTVSSFTPTIILCNILRNVVCPLLALTLFRNLPFVLFASVDNFLILV